MQTPNHILGYCKTPLPPIPHTYNCSGSYPWFMSESTGCQVLKLQSPMPLTRWDMVPWVWSEIFKHALVANVTSELHVKNKICTGSQSLQTIFPNFHFHLLTHSFLWYIYVLKAMWLHGNLLSQRSGLHHLQPYGLKTRHLFPRPFVSFQCCDLGRLASVLVRNEWFFNNWSIVFCYSSTKRNKAKC
jgi:hypothetical protein